MSQHVAILHRRYLDLILEGVKTLECRLTRTARAPFGRVRPGQLLHLKQAGGSYVARARAGEVIQRDQLTPATINALFQAHNDRIHADPAYQHAKANCRYATLIELCDVQPAETGPAIPSSHGIAWFVLDDSKSQTDNSLKTHRHAIDVTLTDGALRNSYVRLPRHAITPPCQDSGQTITLRLPDGAFISTVLTSTTMIRWRGWRSYFRQAGLRPGDRVRFIHTSSHYFVVQFHRHDDRLSPSHARRSATPASP